MKTSGTEFVVIGAGVFGVWTAYMLAQRGRTVTLIDAYGAGNNRSSSGDESRIIRMGYGADELYTRWAARSLEKWQELFRAGKQPLFVNTGVLWLSSAADSYTRQVPSVLEAHGIAHERLSRSELSARFPQIAVDDIEFGVFEPNSGVLLARRAVHAVLDEAIRAGVQYVIAAVAGPEEKTRRLNHLETRSGPALTGETFIFACGAWLPQLFPALLRTRLFPTRQEVFYFGTPTGCGQFKPPAMPVWLHHASDVYCLPDIENRGIKIACDKHGDAFDPDSGDRTVSQEAAARVREHLRRRLPQLENAPVVETRVCQYENTSNGDFLIDRHPEMENVWLVGGGSGHGFKHGPAIGEYVVSRILDSAPGEERFSLERKLEVQKRAVY
jgi:monomeric sarcosine oxidase